MPLAEATIPDVGMSGVFVCRGRMRVQRDDSVLRTAVEIRQVQANLEGAQADAFQDDRLCGYAERAVARPILDDFELAIQRDDLSKDFRFARQ